MPERLQKIVAAAGIASRRKAEQLILEGRVCVNGQTVTRLGTKVDPQKDHVKVDGKLIRPEPLEYFIVNKPQGVLSAASDPSKRPLVTQLVRSRARLYPVGRLDFQSEGLMVLTNDGELTRRLTRAGTMEKVYQVKVHGQPSREKLDRLCRGMRIEGEKFAPCEIRELKKARNCWFEVTLREGKNRQIRRMFEHVGHLVMRVRRTAIGPLILGDLRPGGYRKLSTREVQLLQDKKKQKQKSKKSA
jgi:23S rRNA pseudouridine2605 synthase